ncbi:conjugative transfer signal peptidase TraF [Rhizobium sp. C4]|uniref:conjugative transfer signal peptidase TraF n=1 Tax=Rhizobium sp. C4 TaxID=1349800 RepID=UPI001E4F81BC|nr:conjugative transfer signal peptidase TraF [Rhizobium sp. C4]MCD2175104.1 conjugative transfer signal peptidase TraF [Rhizobium sp. C4]
MKLLTHSPRPTSRNRRFRFVCVALLAPVSLAVAGLAGYRVNVTPSEPIGIWRIRSLGRPPAIGDVVFICPPERPDMDEAALRGYLRSGLCSGGFAPLIKTIVASAGQQVEIGQSVTVDHVALPYSALASRDGKWRPLTPHAGGVVPNGFVFLHSDFVGSFDSRYFGPIPAAGILGLAQEVLTFAP